MLLIAEVHSAPLTLERSQELADFCQSILSISKGIFFAGAINKHGRILESRLRDDWLLKNLDSKDLEMLFIQCSLQASMIKDYDIILGPARYALVERNSAVEFVFPFHLGIILVIAKPDVYPRKLAVKISKLVNEFDLLSEAKKLR